MPVVPQIVDMVGKRFGRLTVCGEAPPRVWQSPKRRVVKRHFECICDCASASLVGMENLRSGLTRSCGCLHEETIAKGRHKHGDARKKARAPEYAVWANMIGRCERPSVQRFKHYGGRGITVCRRWRDSYEAFLSDMGRKPTPKHSIDRIDVNGNYEPGNCRWATSAQQRANQRPKSELA